MKPFFTTALLIAAAGLTTTATATPIAVTGYDADIVAEAGNGAITTVTNAGVIANIFTLAEVGYTGVTGTTTGTPLTITGDTVTTQNGTVFSVDADANNAIINDGTLTLVTSGKYEDLQILLFQTSGSFTATLTFADTSTSDYSPSASFKDWGQSDAFDAFATKTAAPRRDTNNYNPSAGLYMREVNFDLSAADQLKDIVSIEFDFTTDRASVLGVSGTLVPEPSSLALLGLGGLCVLRRRRG